MKILSLCLTLVLVLAIFIPLSSGRQVVFENGCCRDVRVVVSVLPNDGVWRDFGWYNFAPGEGPTALEHDGLRLMTDNPIIYYYAETTDGKYKWQGNEGIVNLDGRKLPMRAPEWGTKNGNFYKKITCEDLFDGKVCKPSQCAECTTGIPKGGSCKCGCCYGEG